MNHNVAFKNKSHINCCKFTKLTHLAYSFVLKEYSFKINCFPSMIIKIEILQPIHI